MPEGPEIRRAADSIAKVIEGKLIEDVIVGLDRLAPYVSQLKGQRVREVETRGKAMLIHFNNGLSVYSHNQLYGVWKTAKRGTLPKTKRSLRLALHTETESALLYSASDIEVHPFEALCEHPFLKRIGPDILDKNVQWQDIKLRLQDRRFINRTLSALYLDQHFIAGIGNYLRSEILFAARVHPDLKPKLLNDSQLDLLAKQTLIIGQRAYKTRGHTVPDDIRRHLAKNKTNYEGARFMVFNRESQPCRECVNPILKAQRNGRRIYWCENCQSINSEQRKK
uniref:endonuclease VIII n=1 Tax=Ningiella ruwaisensis TaxID=2364274 RepID=UPI00109F6C6D|nr:endonuclease VIII [Ningiella ruwaisensis]